jgi:ABC-type multidrug transport system fused ATPase/permease subunit
VVETVLKKYLKKYSGWIVISVLFSILHNYLNLQLPILLQRLVDDIALVGRYDLLPALFGELVIIFFFAGVCGLFRTLITQYIGTNVVYNIRGDMFRALQQQSYSFYDKNRTGDIMSRATGDVNVSRNFLSQQFGNLIRDFFTLVIILVIVFRINWQLSLIFLTLVPILFGLMIWYRKKMYGYYLTMSKRSGTVNSVMQENITGIRVVKAFARESYEMKKFKEQNDYYLKSHMNIIRLSTNYGPTQEFITMMGSVMLLFIGGTMVINGDMTVGEVVSFYVFFAFLYDPIRNMVNVYAQFSQVEASMVRINSILENKSEITEKEDAMKLEYIKGAYEFKDVKFSYEEDDHYALRGLNFDVKPGETMAILGATGSGKSTLINLIPRFYDPTSGSILLDGEDVQNLKIDDYRRQIGVVSQDIFLFSRTIGENIGYGSKKGTTQEDIERVAKIAAIHNFIINLPDGYKTKVGERGQTLSGGQKQRIAIARALLTDPRILILDDSLSAVDIDTEAQIQQALDTLFKGRTTFIITQRISTIQNSDRIMVLEFGQIIELGTHEELYDLKGIYTQIYDTMFKAQSKGKKRKERLREQARKLEADIPFEDVLPGDAEALIEIYREKYPDEEKRLKMEEQLRSKIQKQKIKDLRIQEKLAFGDERKNLQEKLAEEIEKDEKATLKAKLAEEKLKEEEKLKVAAEKEKKKAAEEEEKLKTAEEKEKKKAAEEEEKLKAAEEKEKKKAVEEEEKLKAAEEKEKKKAAEEEEKKKAAEEKEKKKLAAEEENINTAEDEKDNPHSIDNKKTSSNERKFRGR